MTCCGTPTNVLTHPREVSSMLRGFAPAPEHDVEDCNCCNMDPGIAMGPVTLDPDVEHEVNVVWFDGGDNTLPAVAVYVDGTLQNFSFQSASSNDYDGEEYCDGLCDGLSMAAVRYSLTRFRYHIPIVEEGNPPQSFIGLDGSQLDEVPEDDDDEDEFVGDLEESDEADDYEYEDDDPDDTTLYEAGVDDVL